LVVAVNFTGLSSAYGVNADQGRRSLNNPAEVKASDAAADFPALSQPVTTRPLAASASAGAKASGSAGAASQFASAVQDGDADAARKAMQKMLEELALISSVQSMLSPASGDADMGLYSPKRSATSAVRDLLANPHFQRLQDVLEDGDSSQIKQAWSELVGGK
jgi:DNA-binding PucR family transcriptional regulator